MIRSLPYAVRRVRQTLSNFDNGPQILAGLARQRLTGRPPEIEYRLAGGTRVTCPNRPGARMPIYEVFIDDTYRIAWFTRGLGPHPVAVDIGGHIGSFALAFIGVQPDGRVHSFEASPATAEYLRRNVAANDLGDRVTVHEQAVSDTTGTLSFADNGAGSIHNGITSPEETTTIEIPCLSITDALDLAGPEIDLLKLDAEGAEYDIVLQSKPEEWARVRRIVMEYHDRPGFTWAEIETFFASAGLRVVRQEPVDDRLGLAWLARDPLE